MRNLHTWTICTGIDPEENYGLTPSRQRNRIPVRPPPTYFTLRLNLKY